MRDFDRNQDYLELESFPVEKSSQSIYEDDSRKEEFENVFGDEFDEIESETLVINVKNQSQNSGGNHNRARFNWKGRDTKCEGGGNT